MRTYKVKKEHEYRNEIVCGGKERKILFGLVPSFELLIKAFNQVIGDIVLKALDANKLHIIKKELYRHFVSGISVGDNPGRFAKLFRLIVWKQLVENHDAAR